ncbi:RNA-directed DNA polymerase from mobile element jockey [Folsomia candida]|uniref:RNA-directed DNA polymerase from mobile element jockey n=1 Tax=Folsomia candida TaxID=158441 RepID=A0A226DPE6_FOLCA|nr:RNA-directed DNA polymerase from mobile element jockey [Folsomia candida]
MDKRLYTGGLFIDFQSAFNKVIHVLLIRKLKKIGIQGTALKLLESYLADIKIRVKVNGCISKQGKLRVGIPQGGGISSVLFAVFINDLPPCLKETLVIIYYYHKSPKIIQDILNEDLKAIQEWSIKNGMEINWSKTHSMLFQPPKMRGTDDFHISIEDHTVQKVKSFKYLGVVLDEQLTFDDHYDQTCKAVTSRIHLISRHKHSFSHERLIIFSKSLIVSVIDYCIPVWGELLVKPCCHSLSKFKTPTTRGYCSNLLPQNPQNPKNLGYWDESKEKNARSKSEKFYTFQIYYAVFALRMQISTPNLLIWR